VITTIRSIDEVLAGARRRLRRVTPLEAYREEDALLVDIRRRPSGRPKARSRAR
jgi:hypothetical protein